LRQEKLHYVKPRVKERQYHSAQLTCSSSDTVAGAKQALYISARLQFDTVENDWTALNSYVEDLTVLITTLNRDFIVVLDFKGLVRDGFNRFALVYDLSSMWEAESSKVNVTYLRQLICDGYKTSLTCRLAIALRLFEDVLQFCTAGWLHKEADLYPRRVGGGTAHQSLTKQFRCIFIRLCTLGVDPVGKADKHLPQITKISTK
jgi:hypothetical protein